MSHDVSVLESITVSKRLANQRRESAARQRLSERDERRRTVIVVVVMILIIIMIIILRIVIKMMIIIMIIHLFAGAFQDTQSGHTKQSGKGTTSSVCPMGITDLEGLE